VPRKPFPPELLQAKREAIFQATRKLLARHDFHDLKIDDIARRAGIAKGSLYLYFKDKDSLYAGLVQSLFDKLFPQISQILKSNADPGESLRRILEVQVAFFEEHIDVFVHFFREGPGSSARENSLKNCFREYVGGLTETIQKGIARGRFREVDPVKAALILIGMIRSAIVERIHGFTDEPLGADIDKIWDIYMNGIGR
jgi:AcrR family transcriptional regulator